MLGEKSYFKLKKKKRERKKEAYLCLGFKENKLPPKPEKTFSACGSVPLQQEKCIFLKGLTKYAKLLHEILLDKPIQRLHEVTE